MAAESKSLIANVPTDRPVVSAQARNADASARTLCIDWSGPLQVELVFALIMVAVWTPPGRANTISNLLAALCMVWFTVRGRYSVRELGLARPGSGAVVMLISGVVMVLTMVAVGSVIRSLGPAQAVPWRRAWQYAVWALEQEFILQSFFYLRLESLLGSRRAVWGASLLFCIAHLPSPILTVLSLIGGLLFCEMFRRYRNIFPLGWVHATLGLTIAASFPDGLLHHMRVGIGYLLYRP
jgi:membrane protease YdiL (CAAX protease family)